MRPLTAGLLTVLAGVAIAAWFFSTYEKVSSERWTGYRGVARVNPLHAAQRLAEELGFEAESKAALTPSAWLPEPADTLIVKLSPPLTVGIEGSLLIEWVDDGGHLVILPPPPGHSELDEFLAQLSLQIVEIDNVDAQEDAAEYDLDGVGQHAIAVTDTELEAYTVELHGRTVAHSQPWGDGYLTLLTSEWVFDSTFLETGDNARLFADIVIGDFDPGKIWLVYDASFRPLWRLIRDRAPYLVLSLLLLLLLWIWRSLPAFGPAQPDRPRTRRSIIEHISASGVFAWRQRNVTQLHTRVADALLHSAEAKHPGISRRSVREQAESISRITGIAVQQVVDVLQAQAAESKHEFTASMQRSQSIRKEL